ncbi:MAG: hypothetical protein JJ902_05155 [Roseibium sp.]|nr:hypothetical protein [Roseibium sp.]
MAKHADPKALPHPRLITKEAAAHYCSISESSFDGWMRKGLVPPAVEGTNRWDRKAIDARLDELSGLTIPAHCTPNTDSADANAEDHDPDDWGDLA